MYYFINTWWTLFSECWCNGLLNCVPFTYQKYLGGYRYTLRGFWIFNLTNFTFPYSTLVSVFQIWIVIYLLLFYSITGYPARAHGSFQILDLLGTDSVCKSNQGHNPWKVGVLLMNILTDFFQLPSNDQLIIDSVGGLNWMCDFYSNHLQCVNIHWRAETNAMRLCVQFAWGEIRIQHQRTPLNFIYHVGL